MKKYLSLLAVCAITISSFLACTKDAGLEEPGSGLVKHSVTFNVNMDESKTGLLIKIVPTWLETKDANVHLYESHLGTLIEGENSKIITPIGGDYEKAHFSADFSTSIVVTPPTKSFSDAEGYRYGGVVAMKDGDKFYIPSVQYPDSEALIDPDADFLIGDTRMEFEESVDASKTITEMYYVRPVALSRFLCTNLEGSVVKSVKLVSTDKLTGSVELSDIDFENGTAAFDPESGSNEITIDYGTKGQSLSSPFFAYFISLAGSKNIESVIVNTDKYIYTKTIGKASTFTTAGFKSIAIDFTVKEGGNVTREPATPEPVSMDLKFMRESVQVTEDSWEIYQPTGATYSAPELVGVAEGSTVVYESSAPAVATVDSETGAVTIVAEGTTDITATASAVEGYLETVCTYSLTVTDNTPEATTYYKVSSAVKGKSYVIVADGKAITNNKGTLGAIAATAGEGIVKISGDSANLLWTVAANTTSYTYGDLTFGNGGYYLGREGGKDEDYMDMKVSTSVVNKYHVWFFGDGTVYQHGSDNYYYITYKDSKWQTIRYESTTSTDHPAELYSPQAPQTLSFDVDKAEINKDDVASFVKPVLSGAKTTVTYSSSDETKATVANDGTITPLAKGTTVITAKAAETDQYASAEASYTLTVTANGTKYVLVETQPTNWSGTYLIVSHNDLYALSTTAESSKVYRKAVTVSNKTITSEDLAACEFVVTVSDSKYEFHNTKATKGYLAYSTSDPYYTFSSSSKTGTGNGTTQFTLESFSNSLFYFRSAYLKSGSATEYIYYKPSDASGSGKNNFRVGASGSTYGLRLYKKQ